MIDDMIRLSSQGQRIATFISQIRKINHKFLYRFQTLYHFQKASAGREVGREVKKGRIVKKIE